MEFQNKRIVVTGGSGFLGTYVVKAFQGRGCKNVISLGSRDFDLRLNADVQRLVRELKPDVVVHMAAVVGGIGANRSHPGQFFYENAIMGLQLIEACRKAEVSKFVQIGTICSYPKITPVPFKEDELWNGYPEETNAPYGLAKKMLMVQLQSYRTEYGMNGITVMPANLYGPGENFDLETSHVIPALIRKCLEAKQAGSPKITLWGDGTASREFLFVEDAARGIVLATEKYNDPMPVNLGVGREMTIRAVAELVADIIGFRESIEWDPSKPNGQPRRCVDTSRAKRSFGFEAQVALEDGLRRTISWYVSQRAVNIAA